MPFRIPVRLQALAFFAVLAGSGRTADQLAETQEEFRPLYHFSPKKHWTNDPNGLVYFEGEYHLFFQYNPFGDVWGHMSWGHAVSQDLLRWVELPVALREENGIMMFTGSTVVDAANTSGFCREGRPCLVAIYTGHTSETKSSPALQTQNIAFSNDRGRTWTKYSGNPVLNLHLSDFRDPKVFWSAASRQWVMAVSLPNDHKVRFYGSRNLKSWNQLSDFGPAGAASGQWECPEIFELPVDGNPRRTRFVLKVGLNPGSPQGGSGEQYFIGEFDGTSFTNDNPSSLTLLTDYGKDCYCALTFNNLPANHKPVMMGWMDNWDYASELPTNPWRGQMTIPRALGLRTTPSGLRLAQAPTEELQRIRKNHIHIAGQSAADLNSKLAQSSIGTSHTYEIESTIPVGNAGNPEWRVLVDPDSYTAIGYDRQSSTVFVDRTHSGNVSFSPKFPARTAAPVHLRDGLLRLHILVDRDSVEVFAQDGEVALTNLVFPPRNAAKIEFHAPASISVSADLWSLQEN